MHRALLSGQERKQIHAYLKANGEKTVNMRMLNYRANKYLSQIKADLQLIEALHAAYERNKRK